MHQSTLLSLTAITIACSLFVSVSSQYEDHKIEDLLTNLDLTPEKLDQILKDREAKMLLLEETSTDSQADFFVNFSYGDKLEDFKKQGPTTFEELVEAIKKMSQQYKNDLVDGSTNDFKRAVQVPIRNYLINSITANGDKAVYQELIINSTSTTNLITTTTEKSDAWNQIVDGITPLLEKDLLELRDVLKFNFDNAILKTMIALTKPFIKSQINSDLEGHENEKANATNKIPETVKAKLVALAEIASLMELKNAKNIQEYADHFEMATN